jgi:DNA-directed RNA polymerase specialized sigma24 family protein
MAPLGSVSLWIDQLKKGDHEAAQKVWQRYFEQLCRLARRRLHGAPRRAADEEDVALSAFDSLFRGTRGERFPRLADRGDLWQLLVVLAERKAVNLFKHERRRKRGGGLPQANPGDTHSPVQATVLDAVPGPEPTPAFVAAVADECRRLLDKLPEPALRQVALWKMEGYTNEEIARNLGCVPRTVERKLQVIRSLWAEEAPP